MAVRDVRLCTLNHIRLLFLVALVAVQPGCGGEEGKVSHLEEQARTTEESETEALSGKALWLELVPPTKPTKGPQTAVIRLGPSGQVVEREHLKGIRLPDSPNPTQIRVYVGTILRVASHKGMFGAADPEVELLAQVGPEHVAVLIEPLVYLSHFNGEIYVVEALKNLVTDDHKDQVLANLAAAPALVEVLVHRGWTEDAATTLFKVLAERAPYLDVDWVEAAASVAGPEQYEDLKFHLRNNLNHFTVWQAIRDLPGIEPLEPSIVSAWRGMSRKRAQYEWGQLAIAAAHYGHMDGLEFVVEKMETSGRARQAFQNLTGYGPDIEFLWGEDLKKARAWFTANKDRMEFDRTKGRYVVRKP